MRLVKRAARGSPCAWCVCLLIVAAFPLRLAASAPAEDLPVPGGVAALAHSLGIDPPPDRGRFMLEITRLVYETGEVRNASVLFLQSVRQNARNRMPLVTARPAGGPEMVPVPLGADL